MKIFILLAISTFPLAAQDANATIQAALTRAQLEHQRQLDSINAQIAALQAKLKAMQADPVTTTAKTSKPVTVDPPKATTGIQTPYGFIRYDQMVNSFQSAAKKGL